MKEILKPFFEDQLAVWDTAWKNYTALSLAREKTITLEKYVTKIQLNPARITSATAKIDPISIQQRPCFLCQSNRPKEQWAIPILGHYSVLVNPFPIFDRHLTIADNDHTPQCIENRIEDMLNLAEMLNDYVVFYNGPQAGASAPDHMHFQAGNKGFLPLEKMWRQIPSDMLRTYRKATLRSLDTGSHDAFVIESEDISSASVMFHFLLNKMKEESNMDEPLMNILVWREYHKWIVCIFPRVKHRPTQYLAENKKGVLVSPGAVEMGGVFVLSREEDFKQITITDIIHIYWEVCISPKFFIKLKRSLCRNPK